MRILSQTKERPSRGHSLCFRFEFASSVVEYCFPVYESCLSDDKTINFAKINVSMGIYIYKYIHIYKYIYINEGMLTLMVISCVVTAFTSTLLKTRETKIRTGRWGRRCKQVLDDLRKLKAEALNGILWGTRFGRGYTSCVSYLQINIWLFSLYVI